MVKRASSDNNFILFFVEYFNGDTVACSLFIRHLSRGLVLADQINKGNELIQVEILVIVKVKVISDFVKVLNADVDVHFSRQLLKFITGQLAIVIGVAIVKDLFDVGASLFVDGFTVLLLSILSFP